MKKPLIETRSDLKDPVMRRKSIIRSVKKSCAREGIKVSFANEELPRSTKLRRIATQMKKAGLPNSFTTKAVKVALESEGVAGLMHLWAKEQDKKEREAILADIQDMVDDFIANPPVAPKKIKPLIETNPYLKDPATRMRLIERSVITSCGVEGVKIDKLTPRMVIPKRKLKKFCQFK